MTTEARVTQIETVLSGINFDRLKDLFPQDESYKLKEQLMALEEQTNKEFKTIKEQNQKTVEALMNLKNESDAKDKLLQEYTVKLQNEIKSMQDTGNEFAQNLSDNDRKKWQEQYELLNVQFTTVNDEFVKHKIELQARAVRLDIVEQQLNTITGNDGKTLQEALNNLINLSANEKSKKHITELKCISNLESIKNSKMEYNLWLERLKSALDQYDVRARIILEAIEADMGSSKVYSEWISDENQNKIFKDTGVEASVITEMRKPIYAVLINKVDNEMAIKIKSASQDGLFSFSILNRWFMETSGDGLADKRTYVMNPQQAKKEEEIYNLIDKWERELLDLQRAAGSESIMSESLMKSALKKICCGRMKEHIDVYENVDSYTKLRNHVMDYALKKLRDSAKTTTNTGMDLSAVMKELQERMYGQGGAQHEHHLCGHEGHDHHHESNNYGTMGKGSYNHEESGGDESKQFAGMLMAMFKGKGKGKGKGFQGNCNYCGKWGHRASECRSKGKGYFGNKGYDKGKGKGKGPCWVCGGPHMQRDCPKGKGKGKGGINELGNWYPPGWNNWDGNGNEVSTTNGEPSKANEQEANLGGGKGGNDRGYYDVNGNWIVCSLEYDLLCLEYEREFEKKQELGSINGVEGETYEKLTMVADSGAVDHVMNKEELEFIPIEETEASKKGLCYSNASGGRIRNYGKRRVTGRTEKGIAARMDIQVADVKRGLASIPRMVDEDNDIMFSKKGSYIRNNPTGTITPMRRDKGVYEFDLYVNRPRRPFKPNGGVNAVMKADLNKDSAFGRLVGLI